MSDTFKFRPRLSLTEAARVSGRSKKTLVNWVKQGRIRAYRVEREIDIDREDLESELNKPYSPIPFSGQRYQKIKARETA